MKLKHSFLYCLLILGLAATGFAATGGPDTFGYTWTDASSGTPYNWIEINNTGSSLTLFGDDESVLAAIPFTFYFYGIPYNTLLISENGYITFPGWNGGDTGGSSIPSGSAPGPQIAPYWQDHLISVNGTVYIETFGISPERYTVIEWDECANYDDPSYLMTYQVIIYENGNIKFQYKDVENGASYLRSGNSASVGIQNEDGSDGLQYSYFEPKCTNTAAVYFTAPPTYDVHFISSSPFDGEDTVNYTLSEVRVTFDSNLAWISTNNFQVTDGSYTDIPGTKTISGNDLIFIPAGNLDYNTIYHIRLFSQTSG